MAIPVISDKQKAEMADQGYTLIHNVFARADMDDLVERIESFQQRHEQALQEAGGTSGISRASEITFTDHLAENDPAIAAFVTRPEFVHIVNELLGPDSDLYWNQSVFKMPESPKEFPWHQDDGYTPVTPAPYLTLWLALNDATADNGTISVLPGSHKRGLVEHKSSPIGLVCHSSDDPDQGVVVPVSAGSIAAFWSLTMHKSGVNRTSGPRKAYVVQYSKAGLRRVSDGELVDNKIALARNGQSVA